MLNLNEPKKERAIIVGIIHTAQGRDLVDEYLDELEQLLATAGAVVVNRVVQERKTFDPAYLIGRGLADHLGEMVKDLSLIHISEPTRPY